MISSLKGREHCPQSCRVTGEKLYYIQKMSDYRPRDYRFLVPWTSPLRPSSSLIINILHVFLQPGSNNGWSSIHYPDLYSGGHLYLGDTYIFWGRYTCRYAFCFDNHINYWLCYAMTNFVFRACLLA